jgi:hypothetical protein
VGLRQATFINWPDTGIRMVAAIRNGIVHFKEVRLEYDRKDRTH